MKIKIDNNHAHYDVGEYELVFTFNERDVLKRYSREYSWIEYDDDDPQFIFVKSKRTGREYYQELGYGYSDLRQFFSSVID